MTVVAGRSKKARHGCEPLLTTVALKDDPWTAKSFYHGFPEFASVPFRNNNFAAIEHLT
jgi:hypothetical protein